MYISICSNLQIILHNLTVVQVSITNLPYWDIHETLSQEFLEASCLSFLLDTSTAESTLVRLLFSVKVENFTVKNSLFSTCHSLMSSSYIIDLCLNCIELWSCCFLIFLFQIGVAQTQGRDGWKGNSCGHWLLEWWEEFWIERKDREKVLRGRKWWHFGAGGTKTVSWAARLYLCACITHGHTHTLTVLYD